MHHHPDCSFLEMLHDHWFQWLTVSESPMIQFNHFINDISVTRNITNLLAAFSSINVLNDLMLANLSQYNYQALLLKRLPLKQQLNYFGLVPHLIGPPRPNDLHLYQK